MVNSSDVRRASRIWWTGSLSLIVWLGAGNDSLGAQERLHAPEAEVDLTPAPGNVSVRTGDLLDEAVAGIRAPLVRYLIEELIAQRLANAQLNADIAEAEAERAEIEDAAREKEAELAAGIAGWRDELAKRAAHLADATAARAGAEARLEEQARVAKGVSARVQKRLAVIKDQLRDRDRQLAAVRAETGDLRDRLNAAFVELERKGAEDDRLVTELAASGMTSDPATVMAQENPAVTEGQIKVLHAAGGITLPEQPEKPAELLSATFVNMLPAMPHPKPRLRAGEIEAWAPTSDMADGGAPASIEAIAMIADGAWVQAGPLDLAIATGSRLPTRVLSAPNSPEIPDIMSMATLPLAFGIAVPDESGETGESADPLERADRWGLNEAAVRLADGLRVTREEALFQRQERVFTLDVEERAFAANWTAEPVRLDPALSIELVTARSELVGGSRGGIRFFPDGSSTGGRIELKLLGDRAAINVQWSTGAVTVER